MANIQILPFTIQDTEKVYDIQCISYPTYLWEDISTFESIIRHGLSWAAYDNDRMVAYMLCHLSSGPSALNTVEYDDKLPTSLFIHDVAVTPFYRNKGISRLLIEKITEPCNLLSIPESVSFWEKHGFLYKKQTLDQRIVNSYKRGVLWMERK